MAASNLVSIKSTIETRLRDELNLAPVIPVVFQNIPYTPPANKSWVQCLVNFGSSSYSTLGGASDSTNLLTGVVTINIFSSKGKGSGPNLVIGKRIRELYNRIIVSGVSFDPPVGPEPLNFSDAEGYFQTQIRVTFDVYEAL